VLPFQVAIVLLTFIAASILVVLGGSAAIVSYHVIFAIGIVPLILGAMVHFVPVLTRSKSPGRMIRSIPIAALTGGVLVTSHFAFPQTAPHGQYLGAAIIATAVASLAYWAHRSGSKAIGAPHPCLNWYLAAMACLLVALGAILMAYFIPGQRAALRLLHLHLNTLGFIGITALGTLQVLLPTAAQRADPGAATRMRRHLKWMVAGTVLVACGAAWYPSLAWVGLALLTIPPLDMFKSWLSLYAGEICTLHGATPALAAALYGYTVAVALGAAHAYHYPSFNPVATFIIAFLMPLVTGAVSYLLPLWLHPGQQTAWHQAARKHLGLGGGLRATILLVGGIIAGLGYRAGWVLAVIAASVFLAQIVLMFIIITPSPYSSQSAIVRRNNAEN
jgi:hypothetical protein